MAIKKLVHQVSIKDDSGYITSTTNIGATFDDVVDAGTGRTNYTLTQFFDSYLNFMRNADFIYAGGVEPKNPKVVLWLDTSETNGL